MNYLQQSTLFSFALQFRDLRAQTLVFLYFYLQELYGHARFLFYSVRGEQVGIGQLVVAVAEIADFQESFADQCIQTEIDFTQADAQALRQISLGKAGVIFQGFKQTVAGGGVVHGCAFIL